MKMNRPNEFDYRLDAWLTFDNAGFRERQKYLHKIAENNLFKPDYMDTEFLDREETENNGQNRKETVYPREDPGR